MGHFSPSARNFVLVRFNLESFQHCMTPLFVDERPPVEERERERDWSERRETVESKVRERILVDTISEAIPVWLLE